MAVQLLRSITQRAFSGLDIDVMSEQYKLQFFGSPYIADTLTLEAPRWIIAHKLRQQTANGDMVSIHRRNPLGCLDLPVEILRMIIIQLDLISIRAFSISNTYFRRVLQDIPEYDDLVKGAPQFCYLLVQTQLARHFALHRIYCVLTHSECAVCRGFAHSVFLPGMQRCCYRCLQVDPEFQPITPTIAQWQYGVPKKRLSELPMLESLPGRYSNDQGAVKTFSMKRRLISRMEARRLGSQKGKDLRWGRDLIWTPDLLSHEAERNMCIIYLGVRNAKGLGTEYGLHCNGCVSADVVHRQCSFRSPKSWHCRRYSLPAGIDVEASDQRPPPQHGILSCAIKTDAIRLYTKQTLLEHVQNCQTAKTLVLQKTVIAETRILTQPIWTLIFVVLPSLYWGIESYLDEGAPEGMMGVLQASKSNCRFNRLEEATWTLCRHMFQERSFTSRTQLMSFMAAIHDALRDLLQASGILKELQMLNCQILECQLSEEDSQDLRAVAAMREKMAIVVSRLTGMVENVCARSDEDVQDGSKVPQNDVKPHVRGKYNLRSRR